MKKKIEYIVEAEKEIIRAYKKYFAEHKFSPSVRDLMEMTNTPSTSMLRYRLVRLEEKGYLKRVPYISRSIILTTLSDTVE